MSGHTFDYEDVFMGVSDKKPKTYKKTFAEDYRLRSLTTAVKLTHGRILDIGCGGGRIAETLPYYYPKASVYGCDVSKKAIQYAKKLGSGKVTYTHMKSKKLPYKDNFFDVCICLDVLEHVPDVDFFLKEVRRVLKTGGSFFVIVPCEGQPFTYTWVWQKLHLGDQITFRYFGHIHPEFTYQYVQKLLVVHKFLVKETRYSEHWFYQLSHLCIFFLPKLLLEVFLGKKKAHEYDNSSLISKPKTGFNPLISIRAVWFKFFDFMMMYPMSWETILLKRIPFGAWKLHVLAKK